MITVGMNYDVLDGKQALFEGVFEKVLAVMNGMPGHTQSRLYREVHSPTRYLIISEWADRGAFDAFIQSDRFRSVTNWGKEQVLAARPRHEIYGDERRAAQPSGCPVPH